jgi:hypothetical protein
MATMRLTEEAVNAIAAAIWSRQLPLDTPPVVSYGSTSLSSADLDAISYTVWNTQP